MSELFITPLERALLAGVPGEADSRRRVDLAVIPVWTDERPLQGLGGLLDWRVAGRLSALVRTRFCHGGEGESVLLPGERRLPASRLVLVGMGSSAGFDADRARRAGARLVEVASALRPREVLLALPTTEADRERVEAMLEGVSSAVATARGAGEPVWWVVAEPGHVGRLRAHLEGPPRAAEEA